jgi:bifunctional DNA-binding transcriptional regulator/antitoxin component of YhaV-PrlF toxin-antitoxin module
MYFTLPNRLRIVVCMSHVYTLKISPQGQLTLPRDLRERLHVQPDSPITVAVTDDGSLQIASKPPITKHFGTLAGLWTAKQQDAAEYTRELRNSMQPKR